MHDLPLEAFNFPVAHVIIFLYSVLLGLGNVVIDSVPVHVLTDVKEASTLGHASDCDTAHESLMPPVRRRCPAFSQRR